MIEAFYVLVFFGIGAATGYVLRFAMFWSVEASVMLKAREVEEKEARVDKAAAEVCNMAMELDIVHETQLSPRARRLLAQHRMRASADETR